MVNTVKVYRYLINISDMYKVYIDIGRITV